MALAQSYGERDTWIRWADSRRKLVDLAHCPSAGILADDLADDPEPCQLFDGHPGNHSFDRGAAPLHGRNPSPDMQRRMDDLLGD